MDFIVDILRNYPALALFLTLGIGFYVGRLRIGSFTLGSVTAVLIVGVIIGQLNIPLSSDIKNVFFMLFLFSIGYSVGPQFFRSLRGMGLRQVCFAMLMSFSCFLATLGLVYLFGFSPGESVGLFSGSQTCSAILGVGGDAITNFGRNGLLSPEQVKEELDLMPVCYAVTYIYGTLGTVIILGTFGPRLLGGIERVKADTAAFEAELDDRSWLNDPANVNAHTPVTYRTFIVEDAFFEEGPTVSETEKHFRTLGLTVYVDRIRRILDGTIVEVTPSTRILAGDTIVLTGRREFILDENLSVGPEVNDSELMEYPVRHVPVLLVDKKIVGLTVKRLRRKSFMRGVVIEDIRRGDTSIDVNPDTVLERRDTIRLMGRADHVDKAIDRMGYADAATHRTDLMFVGMAIFIGGFIGALPIIIGGIPLSFGTSGGSLLAGLFFGWLRQRRPTLGKIPDSALWLMNTMGLNVFIAVIGITAAPSFISGIERVGFGLLAAGIIGTTIPLLIGLWLGHKVFKFHPALTLGCCAGTRTCTASLGAVQERLGSTLPTMGYTVTYAVSNILLVIWGLLTVVISS